MREYINRITIIVFILIILPKANESTNLPMNATLSPVSYYYIQTSEELSKGIFYTNETGANENIQYGLISGSLNNNAVWNYNKTTQKTEYWVYAFVVGVNIDICHGATNHLCTNPGCSGPNNYMIDISNAKWSRSFENDVNNPSLSDAVRFVLNFDDNNRVVNNLGSTLTIYLRYWLDVPSNTPPYDYNTTYQLMAVLSGGNCV